MEQWSSSQAAPAAPGVAAETSELCCHCVFAGCKNSDRSKKSRLPPRRMTSEPQKSYIVVVLISARSGEEERGGRNRALGGQECEKEWQ